MKKAHEFIIYEFRLFLKSKSWISRTDKIQQLIRIFTNEWFQMIAGNIMLLKKQLASTEKTKAIFFSYPFESIIIKVI